ANLTLREGWMWWTVSGTWLTSWTRRGELRQPAAAAPILQGSADRGVALAATRVDSLQPRVQGLRRVHGSQSGAGAELLAQQQHRRGIGGVGSLEEESDRLTDRGIGDRSR